MRIPYTRHYRNLDRCSGGKKVPDVTLLCFLENKRFHLSLLGNTIQSANEVAKVDANTQGLMEENGFET